MPYDVRSVLSADGTVISYRASGRGPGVVLLHGGMQAAQSFSKLAEALAGAFTVYVPDRRGRGRSGPFGEGYGLDKERDDLAALLGETGARRVFGLSSGALIALHAAQTCPELDQIALYEPPLTVPGANPAAWVPAYEREIARGDLAAAMVSVLKGTGDVELLTYVPRFVLVPLIRWGLARDAGTANGADVALRDLIPTLHFDAVLQRESATTLEGLAALRCEILLLGGDRSARSLRIGLDALEARLPSARRVRLRGVGHTAAADDGRPAEVARALGGFFGAPRPAR
jgi:pimeloyl-ACP methyl ester carboxylesterase